MARIVVPNAPKARKKYHDDRANPAELLRIDDPGASRAGNTHYKRMRTCPREHALREIVGLTRPGDAEALTMGLAFHLALETYYREIQAHQRDFTPEGRSDNFEHFLFGNLIEAEAAAWAVIEPMRGADGYDATWAELERILAAYFDVHRRKDRWRIVAVEETLEYEDGGLAYTARLDLVVECYDRGGMWVVEHKTARAITDDLLAGYQLDQQILGQVWLLSTCVDTDEYPPLRGVLVNIISKHKVPRSERVECMPSRHHLAAFETSMRAWFAVAGTFAALKWPQALGNCAGPARYWSRCDFYNLCYGRPDVTVEQLLDEPAPPGFVKA